MPRLCLPLSSALCLSISQGERNEVFLSYIGHNSNFRLCKSIFKIYTDQTKGIPLTTVELLGGEPEKIRGRNKDADFVNMVEDGYIMLG
jgi:hypothetical protein